MAYYILPRHNYLLLMAVPVISLMDGSVDKQRSYGPLADGLLYTFRLGPHIRFYVIGCRV